MENQNKNNIPFSLTLFGEEGAGATGVDAASQTGETGIPAQSQGDDTARQQAFDSLISGEYKDLYDARVSQIVQKRLKHTKQEGEQWTKAQGLLTALSEKYGVEKTDLTALEQAVRGENTPNPAQHSGREALARQVYEDLSSQADALKQVYPSFDIQKELANPQFSALLRIPSVDMQTAYELTHKEEILPAVIAATQRQVESRIAKTMASGGLRPRENGNASQSAPLVKQDVSTFTHAQMDDICKRVSRGEKIYLR